MVKQGQKKEDSIHLNVYGEISSYPFKEHWTKVIGLRMHYVDEGPKEGPVILLLHGVPSWSYIYRNIIPALVNNGFRVIAPDMIGFGKSEKLVLASQHSYTYHIGWLSTFINNLDLNQIVLFGQDWGAILGMHLAVRVPDRIRGLILSNGVILTGEEKLPLIFYIWKWYTRFSPRLPVGRLIDFGCKRKLTKTERDAYEAPFLTKWKKSATRALPSLVPTRPNHPTAHLAWEAWEKLVHWEKPVLTLFSDGDPITRNAEKMILQRIPGASAQSHKKLIGGHFIQEDAPEEIVEQIIKFTKSIKQ